VVLPFLSLRRREREREREREGGSGRGGREGERCVRVAKRLSGVNVSRVHFGKLDLPRRQSTAANRLLPQLLCQTGSRSGNTACRGHTGGIPVSRRVGIRYSRSSDESSRSSLGCGSSGFLFRGSLAPQGRGVFHLRAITILARFPVRIISNVDERSVIPGCGGAGESATESRVRGHILPRGGGKERERDERTSILATCLIFILD
jgi:hypothetical protein